LCGVLRSHLGPDRKRCCGFASFVLRTQHHKIMASQIALCASMSSWLVLFSRAGGRNKRQTVLDPRPHIWKLSLFYFFLDSLTRLPFDEFHHKSVLLKDFDLKSVLLKDFHLTGVLLKDFHLKGVPPKDFHLKSVLLKKFDNKSQSAIPHYLMVALTVSGPRSCRLHWPLVVASRDMHNSHLLATLSTIS
jgi:hypothetical protein